MMGSSFISGLTLSPAFCWLVAISLAHAIWQCAILLLAYRAVVRARICVSFHARFVAAFVTLLLMGLAPFGNAWWISQTEKPPEVIQLAAAEYVRTGQLQLFSIAELARPASDRDRTGAADGNTLVQATAGVDQAVAESQPSGIELATHDNRELTARWEVVAVVFICIAYSLGLIGMMVKLGVVVANHWRLTGCFSRKALARAMPKELKKIGESAAAKLGRKLTTPIGIFQGHGSAVVVGFLRPTVFIHISLATGLSPQQLEQVLAHELAHVYRYDPLTQLIQRVVESLLFFHPAVWYLSREVSNLRELCCDEVVVRSHSRVQYAQTLLKCAEFQRTSTCGNPNSMANLNLAATGSHPSQLRARIVWLLQETTVEQARFWDRLRPMVGRLALAFAAIGMCLVANLRLPPVPHVGSPIVALQVADQSENEWEWTRVDTAALDPGSFLFGGQVLKLRQEMPEDVIVKIPLDSQKSYFAQWQFGDFESTSVAILVEKNGTAIEQIFLDRNRDRVLEPHESLQASAGRGVWFTDLDVEIRESNRVVHATRQIAITVTSGAQALRVSTLGHAAGRIVLGGRSIGVQRVDRDGNGLPTDNRDQVSFDLNDDEVFDSLSEQYSVRPVLELAGTRYALSSDQLGQTLQLNANSEYGSVHFRFDLADPTAQLESLEGSLRDEHGMVIAVRSDKLDIEVPAGHYAIENLVIQVRDAKGTIWKMTLAGDSEQSWFQVRKDQQHEVALLESLEFRATQSLQKGNRQATEVVIEPSLHTSNGLVVTNFTCDDPRVGTQWNESVVAHFQFAGDAPLDNPQANKPGQCSSAFG